MFSLHTKRKRIILSVVFSIAALVPVTAIVTNLIKNFNSTYAAEGDPITISCYRVYYAAGIEYDPEDPESPSGLIDGSGNKLTGSGALQNSIFDSGSGVAGQVMSCKNPGSVSGFRFTGYWRVAGTRSTSGGGESTYLDTTSSWVNTSALSVPAEYTMGNVSAAAVYEELPTYTATLNSNGGTGGATSASCTVTSGTSCNATVSSLPTKEGFELLGWADSADVTSATYGKNSIPLSGNKTVYAVWAELNTFTLTVVSINMANGGGVSCDLSPRVQSASSTEDQHSFSLDYTIPSCSGWSYKGLSIVGYPRNEIYSSSYYSVDPGSNVIYALWEADGDTPSQKNTYTVELNYNDGTGNKGEASCETYGTSCNATVSSLPTRDGYTLLGWADSSTATSATYEKNSIPLSGNKTVYAVWEKNSPSTVEYTATLNNNGGTGGVTSVSCTATSGSSCNATISSLPTRDGYTLLGWADSADAISASYEKDSIPLSGDKTVYAVWEEAGGEDEADPTLTWVVGPEHVKKSEDDLVFTVDRSKDDFIRLEIDGEVVDEENYKVEAGEGDTTVITVYRTYLDTLDDGSHDIVAVFRDNNDGEVSAESKFSVVTPEEEETPSTVPNTGKYTGDDGNGINMLIALPVFGAIAVAGSLYVYRRKKAHIKFEL